MNRSLAQNSCEFADFSYFILPRVVNTNILYYDIYTSSDDAFLRGSRIYNERGISLYASFRRRQMAVDCRQTTHAFTSPRETSDRLYSRINPYVESLVMRWPDLAVGRVNNFPENHKVGSRIQTIPEWYNYVCMVYRVHSMPIVTDEYKWILYKPIDPPTRDFSGKVLTRTRTREQEMFICRMPPWRCVIFIEIPFHMNSI